MNSRNRPQELPCPPMPVAISPATSTTTSSSPGSPAGNERSTPAGACFPPGSASSRPGPATPWPF